MTPALFVMRSESNMQVIMQTVDNKVMKKKVLDEKEWDEIYAN